LIRSSIHNVIVKRLFFSWLLISIILGGLATQIGSMRNEERLLALALGEVEKLSRMVNDSISLGNGDIDNIFAEKFRQVVASQLVMGELYSTNGVKILESAAGSADRGMLTELRSNSTLRFLGHVDYQRRKIAGQPVLLFMLPMKDSKARIVAYFKGAFAVDQATVKTLKNDLVLTVGIVLVVVLTNTLMFYPVILSLNRDTIAFSRKVIKGNTELMAVLGSAIAKRDSDTSSHNYRVTLYAVALAEAAGLSHESIRALIAGAFLHDVGKIGISDSILLKPARLTPEEFDIMKSHVSLGGDILKNSSWLAIARDVVEYHHEKYDGTGYNLRLKNTQIPVTARVFAIVDVFDALTSERPYKKALSLPQALEIIKDDSGSHFDPQLAALFTGLDGEQFEAVTGATEAEMESNLQVLLEKYFSA